jgi:hypothetical protein
MLNTFCFGQNRVNDKLPQITKTNGQLLNAFGWLKNNSGQWISRKNKIPFDLGKDQKALENYQSYSLGQDNFISFELKNIEIKDSSYTILIKKFRDGFYRYPTIQEDWNFSNSYAYYIFENAELEKLKNIKTDTLNTIEIVLKSTDVVKFVDFKTLTNSMIVETIQENLNKHSFINSETSFSNGLPYTFPVLYIDITYFKNKKIVQFYISPKLYEIENQHYYETDLAIFSKFIKLE